MPYFLLVAKILSGCVYSLILYSVFQIYFLILCDTLKLLLNIFSLIQFKDLSR